MRITLLLTVIVVVLSCCLVQVTKSQQQQQQQQQQDNQLIKPELPEQEDPSRDSLTPSKLFDFDRFKSIFKKRYGSVLEELARKKIFMVRAFHAFLSLISYKHNKSTCYMKINEMSDWTKAELQSMYIDAEDHSQFDSENVITDDERKETGENKDSIEEELVEIVKDEPVYSEIIAKLTTNIHHTRTRASFKRSMRFKLSNQDNDDDNDIVSSENEGNDFIGGLITNAMNMFNQDKSPSSAEPQELTKKNEVFYDYRQSNCLTPAKNQGKCGSCYIFAVTALYEWFYCNESGQLVEFSEQYPLDCGDRIELGGCKGGRKNDVAHFYYKYGIEFSSNYPYHHKVNSCPYEKSTNLIKMGHLKVKESGLTFIRHNQFENYIRRSPILLGFGVSDHFSSYGGGVDNGLKCKRKNGHSMLIVGSGIEDGLEYWLCKNSFGPTWGIQGYYKISKEAHNCFLDNGSGYVLDPYYGQSVFNGLNDNYDEQLIQHKLNDQNKPFGNMFSNFFSNLFKNNKPKSQADTNIVTPAP